MGKVGSDGFDAQCIPTAAELLQTERYRDFLAQRRKAISLRLNEFLRTAGP